MKIKMLEYKDAELPKHIRSEANDEIWFVQAEGSDSMGYYEYHSFLGNDGLMQLSSPICGVSPCELRIFRERMTHFREFAAIDLVCQKFPTLDPERVRQLAHSALQRTRTDAPKEAIMQKLLEGTTKRELLHSGQASLADMTACLHAYRSDAQYSCHSELEKKVVAEYVEVFDEGQIEFLYTPVTFAERFSIPPALIDIIQERILKHQTCLTESETEQMRSLLRTCEYGTLSAAEKDAMFEMSRRISQFYSDAEKAYYLEQLEEVSEDIEISEKALLGFAMEHCLDYYKLKKLCNGRYILYH